MDITNAQRYPLDKNRKLLSETITTDPNTGKQTILRDFRLFSSDGDSVDIQYEQRLPEEEQGTVKHLYENKKVVSQTKDAQGRLHKIALLDEKTGETKEFFVVEQKKRASDEVSPSADVDLDHVAKRTKSVTSEIEPIIKLLLTTKVEELKNTEEGKIFVAYKHEAAQQVFQALIQHQFLSCPVLNRVGTFQSFVDMLDYVNYFVGSLSGKDLMTPGTEMWSVIEKQSAFANRKVKEIISHPTTPRSSICQLSSGYSLYSAIEAMVLEPRLRRIPILNFERKMVNLITQSQLMEFVYQNMHLVDERKRQKVLAAMPELFHDVICVQHSEFALEAFKKMHQFNLGGVAVVGSGGELVGNISDKDLRGIDADGKWFSRLFAKAADYTSELYQNFPETKRPGQLVCATAANTLEDVIKMIFENGRIHRVYIVNENKKPIGVIGFRDILQQIIAI